MHLAAERGRWKVFLENLIEKSYRAGTLSLTEYFATAEFKFDILTVTFCFVCLFAHSLAYCSVFPLQM